MQTALLLFVYNRPRHTARTLRALAGNLGASSTRLMIFSDGPGDERDESLVQEVRVLCKKVKGFGSVEMVEREKNLGLATSIRHGVSEALADVDAVAVMEDDLITSPFFLNYSFGALSAYEGDSRLLSVSAFVPPRILMPRPRDFRGDVWLSKRNLSFGWGVWKDRWESVNWDQAEEETFVDRPELHEGFSQGGADLPVMMKKQLRGETDSWAIHFSYAHFRQAKYSLLPRESYVRPIGFDGSGVHCRPSPLGLLSNVRQAKKDPDFPKQLQIDTEMQESFRKYFDRQFRFAQLLGRV